MSSSNKRLLLLLTLPVLAVCATVLVLVRASDRRPLTIRFAYQNRVASAACIVAVEKQFFADEGLTVEAYRFNSGPACCEALVSGRPFSILLVVQQAKNASCPTHKGMGVNS